MLAFSIEFDTVKFTTKKQYAGNVKQMKMTCVLTALIVKMPVSRTQTVQNVLDIPLAQFMKRTAFNQALPVLLTFTFFQGINSSLIPFCKVLPDGRLFKCHWLICSLWQVEDFNLKGSFFVSETRTHSSNLVYWLSAQESDTICYFVFIGHLIIFYTSWESS